MLVTGGAGFIGSAVVAALVARGDQVTVLDSFEAGLYDPAHKHANLRWATAFGPVEVVRGDVRDGTLVDGLLQGVQQVVHLAALGGVRRSMDRAAEYRAVNAEGTAHLLAAAHRAGVQHAVIASSSSVYGDRTGPLREGDSLGAPESPYAASKQAMEGAVAETPLPCAVLRFFTVYGPRQRPDMGLSRFLACHAAGRPLPVYGDGSSTRDYTYIDDAVRAVLAAMGHRGTFNIAGGTALSLQEVLETLARVSGRLPEVQHQPRQPGDVAHTRADLTHTRAVLGWTAEVPFEQGLAAMWRWQ